MQGVRIIWWTIILSLLVIFAYQVSKSLGVLGSVRSSMAKNSQQVSFSIILNSVNIMDPDSKNIQDNPTSLEKN